MSLTAQLASMSTKQIQSLYNTMLDVSLAVENGNPEWRQIFRVAINKHNGRQKKIYELLYNANLDEIENLIDRLIE